MMLVFIVIRKFPQQYNAYCFFAAGGITVRVEIRCSKRCGFDMRFLQKSYIFRFLAWDSISQPHGEGDFAIHYTIDAQLLGSLAPLFCFVYKCGYLRALTINVWSEHPCGISLFWLLMFLLFLLLFFFLFTGWLESSVRVFSFFREVFVLFSFTLRSSFAPRMVASCTQYNVQYFNSMSHNLFYLFFTILVTIRGRIMYVHQK
jgi:hypothetical protein